MKIVKQLEIKGKSVDFVLLNLRVPEEMDAYYQIFVDCFGERANVSPDTFNWFNLQPPFYDNFTFAFIDKSNDRLMACYGLLPGDALLNGKLTKYVLCTNVMSHPNYAGQGLFTLIGDEALKYVSHLGISFAFGVPNDLAIRGHLKVGWEIVNELKFYENLPISDLHQKINSKVEINKIHNFNDFDFFGISQKYSLAFGRSAKWMDWRLNKPFSNYMNLSIDEPGAKAFIVLKKYTDQKTQQKKLHIVDFGYETLESFGNLIKYTQNLASSEGFNLINIWQYNFNADEVALLVSLGFKETNVVNPIIIHKLGNNIELPATNWHITLFDNDVY